MGTPPKIVTAFEHPFSIMASCLGSALQGLNALETYLEVA